MAILRQIRSAVSARLSPSSRIHFPNLTSAVPSQDARHSETPCRTALRRIWQELHRNRQEAQTSRNYAWACSALKADGISRCRRNNAKAQTWKKQLGSFGSRVRVHGHELFLRPAQG